MASELHNLAEFIVGLTPKDVPPFVRATTSMCILDSVSAALGGSTNSQIKSVCSTYLPLACERADVDLWGQGCKVPLLTAVFLNAMMGHTLELDDVHTKSKTHIGTVVVPAAWSLAQHLGSTGEELLIAVLCGYETMARIGMAFGVSAHRNKGWHVTATAGTFGAAAACAKLLKLDLQHTIWALGLAGAQSFGTWAFLGDSASCKVLNPGRASVCGCEAALLAQSGMSGPEHILTAADGGLLAAMSDAYDVSLADKGLGTVWQICFMDNKPYPCCRSTHCAIDGALALREEYSLSAEEIDHVLVETYLVGNKQCGMSQASCSPKLPVEAKFSTPYTVASALLYGKVSLTEFLPETINEASIQKLLTRVEVKTLDRFTQAYPDHWGCHITIYCTDGRILKKEITDASGSTDNPLSAEQVVTKAANLLKDIYPQRASELAKEILDVGSAAVLPALL